jgi:hypothetical protein
MKEVLDFFFLLSLLFSSVLAQYTVWSLEKTYTSSDIWAGECYTRWVSNGNLYCHNSGEIWKWDGENWIAGSDGPGYIQGASWTYDEIHDTFWYFGGRIEFNTGNALYSMDRSF